MKAIQMKLFEKPFMDSRVKSANVTNSERWIGYFFGPAGIILLNAILCYAVPKAGTTVQVAWILFSYNLYYSIGYTIYYMSHSMMVPLSTRNVKQRDGLAMLTNMALSIIPGMFVALFFPMLIIRAFGALPVTYITMALLADALDHVEWKAGRRLDGFSMSIYTIIFTVSAGLATSLFNLGLSVTGYIPPADDGSWVVQSQSVQTFFCWSYQGFYAIAMIFVFIMMLFYKVEDDIPRIHQEVTVTNTGAYPGKETAELYIAPPQGKLAKPVKTLAAFAKTLELAPGASQTMRIPYDLFDAASYDADAAAFVLEAGDYTILVGRQPAVTLRLDETAALRKVKNALGDPGFTDWQPELVPAVSAAKTLIPVRAADYETQSISYERHPEIPGEISALTEEELAQMNIGAFDPKGGVASIIGNASMSVAGAAGETAHVRDLPVLIMADGPAGLRISRDYTKDETGVHAVGETMPQSTLELLGGVQRFIMKLISRPKKQTGEVYHQYCTAIPIGTAIAQSRNTALAEALGDLVGDEMERFGIHLWLAPALNIQRDIRCGRNFEYYSEDPLISGKFAAAITNGVLGKEEDAAAYEALAAELLREIRGEYFTPSGRAAITTQTGLLLAYRYGLSPDPDRIKAQLAARMKEDDGHLKTGFVGTPLLLPVLSDCGLKDMAYDLLLYEDYPGWLYEVKMGATTVWERWNSVGPDGKIAENGMNSLNHYSYGAVCGWLFRSVCGISVNGTDVRIAPMPDPHLSYAQASYNSPLGRIESGWHYEGAVVYEIRIPANVTAQIILPDGEPRLFDGRVYLYGSHDAFGGENFCVNDYVCWSAPAENLADWRYEGVIYRKDQDPKNPDGKKCMCAPDVVRGADGRYYLYYEFADLTITSVAVCDTPAGQYEFYGYIQKPDGTPYGTKKGEVNLFDPGVLIDDDGSVYMFTGFSPAPGFLKTVMGLRGLNDGPLEGKGTYEARIACNLQSAQGTFAYLKTREKDKKNLHPYFTQSGGDREDHPDQYIANMRDGASAGFKYILSLQTE